jgi:hypothetical protein
MGRRLCALAGAGRRALIVRRPRAAIERRRARDMAVERGVVNRVVA